MKLHDSFMTQTCARCGAEIDWTYSTAMGDVEPRLLRLSVPWTWSDMLPMVFATPLCPDCVDDLYEFLANDTAVEPRKDAGEDN